MGNKLTPPFVLAGEQSAASLSPSRASERIVEMEDQLHLAQVETKNLKDKNRKLKVCRFIERENGPNSAYTVA